MNPERQQHVFRRALTALQNGDAASAEKMCSDALVKFPEDPNFLCLSARALMMLGSHGQAEERVNNAMTLFPEFPRPHVVRGELRLTQGRLDEAAADFRRAMELGDDDPNTRIKLSRALAMQGDREGASSAVRESLQLDPMRQRLADAFRLQSTGEEAEAEKVYRDVLKEDPNNVDALRLLASLATSTRRHRDAETLLKRALELTPDFGRAMADLVINLVEQDRADEGIGYADQLLKIGADNPNSFLVAGNAYAAGGRYEDAIGHYRKVLEKSPDHVGALSGLAHNLKTIGQQDEAIVIYRRALQANPFFVDTYWNLANLKTFRFSDDEISEMEKLLTHPEIPDESQVFLLNALGFAYEGRKDYGTAFNNFARGNAIKRRLEYYDSVNTEFLFDRIVEIFDAERLAAQPQSDGPPAVPIFIVGLPRSGSTLLEQILASHSRVEGTHELSELARIIGDIPRLRKSTDDRQMFPESVVDAPPELFSRLGREYLERTRKYRSGSPYFTDKNPNNFSNVGLIHLSIAECRHHRRKAASAGQLPRKLQAVVRERAELQLRPRGYRRVLPAICAPDGPLAFGAAGQDPGSTLRGRRRRSRYAGRANPRSLRFAIRGGMSALPRDFACGEDCKLGAGEETDLQFFPEFVAKLRGSPGAVDRDSRAHFAETTGIRSTACVAIKQ